MYPNTVSFADNKTMKYYIEQAGGFSQQAKRKKTYVIYMAPLDGADKMELVWPEIGEPYLLQITPDEGKVSICKMKLSRKPVAASGEEALLQLLNSLGGNY